MCLCLFRWWCRIWSTNRWWRCSWCIPEHTKVRQKLLYFVLLHQWLRPAAYPHIWSFWPLGRLKLISCFTSARASVSARILKNLHKLLFCYFLSCFSVRQVFNENVINLCVNSTHFLITSWVDLTLEAWQKWNSPKLLLPDFKRKLHKLGIPLKKIVKLYQFYASLFTRASV